MTTILKAPPGVAFKHKVIVATHTTKDVDNVVHWLTKLEHRGSWTAAELTEEGAKEYADGHMGDVICFHSEKECRQFLLWCEFAPIEVVHVTTEDLNEYVCF